MANVLIHTLHCGRIEVAPSLAFGGARLPWVSAFATSGARRVSLPVSAYLIEHPHGRILVDTGWSRDASPKGKPDMLALSRHATPLIARELRGSVDDGMTAREQLSKMGIAPRDIDLIIITTLDADHTSALHELSEARRFIVCEEEAWWSYRTHANHCNKLWDDLPFERYYFRGVGRGPSGRVFDLFGDGSVELIEAPGHTKGTTIVKVSSGARFALLCSDAGYSARSWREGLVPSLSFNPAAAKKALDWIAEQEKAPGCVAAFANHDPEVHPGVIEL